MSDKLYKFLFEQDEDLGDALESLRTSIDERERDHGKEP